METDSGRGLRRLNDGRLNVYFKKEEKNQSNRSRIVVSHGPFKEKRLKIYIFMYNLNTGRTFYPNNYTHI